MQGDPIAGSNFPVVPPVPLVPPSLFGAAPSAPELRDPYRSHLWGLSVQDRLGYGHLRDGDYLRACKK